MKEVMFFSKIPGRNTKGGDIKKACSLFSVVSKGNGKLYPN